MSNITVEKHTLRRQIKDKKKQLTDIQCRAQAGQVFKRLVQQNEFVQANHVLCYWSLPDELPTHDFVNQWFGQKQFYLPKVEGKELHLYRYEGELSLKKGAYGIWEPTGEELLHPEVIDLVIIPGIAFSILGHRMGRGGGYYDRLLPRLKRACKIGVCFDFQLQKTVPSEAHDVRMDGVIAGI